MKKYLVFRNFPKTVHQVAGVSWIDFAVIVTNLSLIQSI